MARTRVKDALFDFFDQVDPHVPFPLEPTGFLPGTPEKTAIVEDRVANGFLPWHPDDARGRPPNNSTDYVGVTVSGDGFKVETHRTVEGVSRRFRRSFESLDEALEWLEELDEKYPARKDYK